MTNNIYWCAHGVTKKRWLVYHWTIFKSPDNVFTYSTFKK